MASIDAYTMDCGGNGTMPVARRRLHSGKASRSLDSDDTPAEIALVCLFFVIMIGLFWILIIHFRQAQFEQQQFREEVRRQRDQQKQEAEQERWKRLRRTLRSRHRATVLRMLETEIPKSQAESENGQAADHRDRCNINSDDKDAAGQGEYVDAKIRGDRIEDDRGRDDEANDIKPENSLIVLRKEGEGDDDVSTQVACPICLENYKVGETVVLSGNPLCCHVFHEGCILDHLEGCIVETGMCPCCRQAFLRPSLGKKGASSNESQAPSCGPLN